MSGAEELNKRLFARVKTVQLLGEIQLSEPEYGQVVQAVRDVVRTGQDPGDYPTFLAVAVTEIAARTSDGNEIWPEVRSTLLLPEEVSGESDIGRWYHNYLTDNGLPDFHHLVIHEKARKYRVRVLAHAMVPLMQVPTFMEHVIWPAVMKPEVMGRSGDEIQQRLSDRPTGHQLRDAVRRFVVHGGSVALDFLDRCLIYTRTISAGVPDTGHGLPYWLTDAMREWVTSHMAGGGRVGQAAPVRFKPPSLMFDPGFWRVFVDLPYQPTGSENLTWRVTRAGDVPADYRATVPLWQRVGTSTRHELDGPFVALQAALIDSAGRSVASWNLPSLSREHPVVFFSATTLRARPARDYLEGEAWYVLRDSDFAPETDGERVEMEAPRTPSGAWGRMVAEGLGVAGGSYLRIGGRAFTLVREPPRARLAPGTLPPFLRAVDDGVLAFEQALPDVLLPPGRNAEGDAEADLWRWRLSVRSGEASFTASPAELKARYHAAEGNWRVPLADLIPNEDVGTWDLEVAGPLGQSHQTRLHLLPAMEFIGADTPAIAGANTAPRQVLVATDGDLEVLEDCDLATREGDGWLLEDRNRNGRLPFTIRDPRSGRTTSAVISLPTVHWRWRDQGVAKAEHRILTRATSELLELDRWTLEVEAPPGLRLEVHLIGSNSESVLQSEAVPTTGRGRVPVSRFADTIHASDAAYHQFRLALPRPGGEPLAALVGTTFDPPKVSRLAVVFDDTDLVFTWEQKHSGGNLSARLRSAWSPWETIDTVEVDEPAPGRWQARFPGLANWLGRFRFEVYFEDSWAGSARLYSRWLSVGNEGEQDQYLHGLPRTVAGLLERTLARPKDSSHLRALAARIENSPDEAQELLSLLTGVLSSDLVPGWEAPAWHLLQPALGHTTVDVAAFLCALATAPRRPELTEFVEKLNIPRWRSAWRARGRVPSAARAGLWALWPPLGAVFDLTSLEPDAEERCRAYLGVARGDLTSRQALAAAVGHLSKLHAGSTSQTHAPRDVTETVRLTEAGWEACIENTKAPLIGLAGAAGELSEAANRITTDLLTHYQSLRTDLVSRLGYDYCGVREFPGAGVRFARLFAMSLALAFETRLVARGIYPNKPERPLSVHLRLGFPELHAHDICAAELIVAERFDQ